MPGLLRRKNRKRNLALLWALLLAIFAGVCCTTTGTTPEDLEAARQRRVRRVSACEAKLAAHRVAVASGAYDAELDRITDPEKRARAENYIAASNLLCEELIQYYRANPQLLEPPGAADPIPPPVEPDPEEPLPAAPT